MLEANQVAGTEVNNVAMPSQLQMMYKDFKEKKEKLKNRQREELLSKYGGDQHLEMPEDLKANFEAQMEHLQDLGARGGQQKLIDSRGLTGIRSKYEEDVHTNGHTSVWGSYWHKHFGWGYRCCYSYDKNSQC